MNLLNHFIHLIHSQLIHFVLIYFIQVVVVSYCFSLPMYSTPICLWVWSAQNEAALPPIVQLSQTWQTNHGRLDGLRCVNLLFRQKHLEDTTTGFFFFLTQQPGCHLLKTQLLSLLDLNQPADTVHQLKLFSSLLQVFRFSAHKSLNSTHLTFFYFYQCQTNTLQWNIKNSSQVFIAYSSPISQISLMRVYHLDSMTPSVLWPQT